MIYSIGYQGLKEPDVLFRFLAKYDVSHLYDVRSRPYSRVKKFNGKFLEPACPRWLTYMWVGDRLGGLDRIDDKAIAWLAVDQADKCVCVMCMEANPYDCHRYNEIGRRLADHGVETAHIIVNKGLTHLIYTGKNQDVRRGD